MKRILIFIIGILLSCSISAQVMHGRRVVAESGEPPVGDTQNLVFYSEQLDNAAWDTYAAISGVTANQGNDMDGNPTLELVECGFGQASFYQHITTNISTSTDYVIEFDIYGSVDDNVYVIVEDPNDWSQMINTQYGTSVTGSVQRFWYEFTTEATLGNGIYVDIIAATAAADPSDIYIGRVHLYEGNHGDKDYITTTSSQEL